MDFASFQKKSSRLQYHDIASKCYCGKYITQGRNFLVKTIQRNPVED